jgi:hypothetical protein
VFFLYEVELSYLMDSNGASPLLNFVFDLLYAADCGYVLRLSIPLLCDTRCCEHCVALL